jgi:hypothetical protein
LSAAGGSRHKPENGGFSFCYHVRKLIETYGRKASMMKWKKQLNGDCPKRARRNCTIAAT